MQFAAKDNQYQRTTTEMSNVEYTGDSEARSVENDFFKATPKQKGARIMRDPTELLKDCGGDIEKMIKVLTQKSEEEAEFHTEEIEQQDYLNLCASPELNDGDLDMLENHYGKTVIHKIPSD